MVLSKGERDIHAVGSVSVHFIRCDGIQFRTIYMRLTAICYMNILINIHRYTFIITLLFFSLKIIQRNILNL